MPNEKIELREKLKDCNYRRAYLRATLNVNLPAQIRALRLRSGKTQSELAAASGMMQPRVSAMETPGATNFNVDTLVRVATAFGVGIVIKFVPISEMVDWERAFSQDHFSVVTFENDERLCPARKSAGLHIYSSSSTTEAWVITKLPEPTNDIRQNDPTPVAGVLISGTQNDLPVPTL